VQSRVRAVSVQKGPIQNRFHSLHQKVVVVKVKAFYVKYKITRALGQTRQPPDQKSGQ